jgi:maltose alpha-D-glucosyltransferase/alpha-amylase
MFLRNHDELTLEMVTDVERDYLWSTYASDPRARINLGIRRRLAPLMDNDRRKIELMNSLLLSFPGTPIIYYGDEIGMGDNIYLGDRNGVRTPMQWTPDRNGGFSRCDPARLYAPMIMDPVYGYESVNVEAQSRSLGSLLNWTKRLIAVRKSRKVFGRGSLTFIRPKNRSVLVYVRKYQGDVLLCVANLSRSAQAAEIDLSPWRGHTPLEMLGNKEFPPIGEQPYVVTLAPYGFFWFQLCENTEKRQAAPIIAPELETLVITDGWPSLLQGRTKAILELDVLPGFLASHRWFAERGSLPISTRIAATISLKPGDPGMELALVEAAGTRDTSCYLLPLTVKWQRIDRSQGNPNALAAVRRGSREGVMLDVTADAEFIALVLDKVRASETIEAGNLRLEFRPVGEFPVLGPVTAETVRAVNAEQSNTTALVGSDYVVKLFRRREYGVNPEIEIGRFLTDTVHFANTPALIGTVELVEENQPSAVAVVHRFVENQGDAWVATTAYLDRYVEEQRLLPAGSSGESQEQGAYLRLMGHVGRRLAEMQLALASRSDIADFAPEAVTQDDMTTWVDQALERARRVFEELPRRKPSLSEADRALADTLLSYAERLPALLNAMLPANIEAKKIRNHGDFHLGQMLIVKDDVYIIDFEGEPRRSLQDRRRKAPAARDLAGVIRSIDYSVTAALDRATRNMPDDDGKLARALHDWRARSVEGVLTTYRTSMTDPQLWPTEHRAAARLLDFFLLEKALYELEYEMAHRPEWLRVPLAGTLRILSRSEGIAS